MSETSQTGALGDTQTSNTQTSNASGAAADAVRPGEGTAPAAAAAETPEQKAAFEAKVTEAIKARDEKSSLETKTKTEAEAKVLEKQWGEAKFKAAEGIQRSEDGLKEFSKVARELGLKPDGAQKLLDLADKLELAGAKSRTEATQKAQAEALAAETEGWKKDLRADKEFGGAKFEQTMKEADKAFEKFCTPDVKKFLDETGLSYHPGIIKAFARVGAAMRNDTINLPAGGAPKSAEAALARLYVNSPQLTRKS